LKFVALDRLPGVTMWDEIRALSFQFKRSAF
jgi:hypothetical protein